MPEQQIFALKNRTFMLVMTILIIAAGLLAYKNLGRLEDPTFTIKTALIVTPYPGAGPATVAEEVTDPLEEAIQALGQVKQVYSTSQEGVSLIYVDIKDTHKSNELPQIWDELRRKVSDAQVKLPPGAGPSRVNDDFGDVYGVFYALTGTDYSNAELKDYADQLKNELLKCRDVAKIDIWGAQREAIYVEFQQARLSQLGLSPQLIAQTVQTQNLVQSSGKVHIGDDYIRIDPSGEFASEKQIADLLVGTAQGMVRLSDIAVIERNYLDPPGNMLRYQGKPAIGLGVSTIAGGNVILMGDAVKAKLAALEQSRPKGLELHPIYFQAREVTEASNTFVVNLLEAVAIVIVLLLLFMGWRSGLLIGAVLLLTILLTFAGMYVMDIDLQKVSLGALILALGMLVDNAIVVVDGTLVRMERGEAAEAATQRTVRTTIWPLFGATLVAIFAFAAIGFSPGNVGEFCRSLFDVLAMSLFFSWILAISVTPLFCVWFLRGKLGPDADPHHGRFYRAYRRFLHLALSHRWTVLLVTLVLLVLAVVGFGRVPKAFFPDSTQRYFFVDLWNPQGTHIDKTARDMASLDDYVRSLQGVVATTSFIGEGGLRFMLAYDYQIQNSSYAQLLVEVEDYHEIDARIAEIEKFIKEQLPQSAAMGKKIQNGPNTSFKIEARFRGPDGAVLKELADQAEQIIAQNGGARDLRSDWRTPVKVLRPQFSEVQARFAGVSRSDLTTALQWHFNGVVGGLYREKNKLIPVIFRSVKKAEAADGFADIQVWSSLHRTFIPLSQITTGIQEVQEDALIKRRDREPTVTVQCNPQSGLADAYLHQIRGAIEAIDLPDGYSLEWGGEYEDSRESQEPLARIFPLCILGMFVVLLWLFNSFRRPVIIMLTVPLSLIGVAAGLLLTGLPFGFMAILGFLGLSGMLIKNAIVLIDQIELELSNGVQPYQAVLDASVSRIRPVVMAAGTTILGMLPLVFDPFYSAMAATIMSGLFAATFLTLIVVPVMYSKVYKITAEKNHV